MGSWADAEDLPEAAPWVMIAANGWVGTEEKQGSKAVEAPRKTYRPWDPDSYRQQAYSPQEKLPEDDLVFFLLEVVDLLDLSKIYAHYEDQLRGAPPYD